MADIRQAPGITVVISTHNRRETLMTTLSGLQQLGYPALRIVVVDNASDDGTSSCVRLDFPDVTLLPHSDNRPLRGYNLGFDAVRTPYALVLDDDSCPRPGAIEHMVTLLEAMPDAGAVAANVLGPDGQSEWGEESEDAFSADWFNLIGCGFLVRRSVLVQTRGYDEAFGLYYNDTELALNILSFGHRILYSKKAVIDHRRTRSVASSLKYRLMLRNFPLLLSHHFTGWERLDLTIGHTVIALWRAAKARRILSALMGAVEAPWLSSHRPFIRAPGTNLAIRRFVHRYSLWSNVMRRSPPRAQDRGIDRSVTVPATPLQRTPQTASAAPPCQWESRIRSNPGITLQVVRDRLEFLCGSWGKKGCDCEELLPWYASLWNDYQWHLAHLSYLSCRERQARMQVAREWPYRPKISILTPVYKTPLAHLRECLLSVERQIYPNWEFCAVDDGSASPEIRRILEEFNARYPGQVKLIIRNENRGIARSSQEAFELASGEFIALLDHDDRLAPEALWEVVARLNLSPDVDWFYGDYDKISPDGYRHFYHFKPDWSPELLLGYCYVLHLCVIRRSLVQKVGGFRPEFEGAQDFDLYLRIAEQTDRVEHISRILYSWRQSPDSTSHNPSSKPYSYESARQAIDEALRRRGEPGSCEYVTGPNVWAGVYRVLRPSFHPDVDLVLLSHSERPQSPCPHGWLALQGGVNIIRRFTPLPGEPDGELLARAMHDTVSPFLLVVRNDVIDAGPDTLHHLVANLAAAGVGAAAPKVVFAQDKVDHCGLAWAPGGRLFFPLRGIGREEPAYGAYGIVARNVAAVSPVAVVFRVSALRNVGGFDAGMTATGGVIGACLALRSNGFRIVADGGIHVILNGRPFSPGVAVEPGGRDHLTLSQRHPSLFIGGDPYYNRNLRYDPPDFGVWHESLDV